MEHRSEHGSAHAAVEGFARDDRGSRASAQVGAHDGAPRERPVRTMQDPVVTRAWVNVQANVSAMSASEILQLALFPRTLHELAAEVGVEPAMLSNLLRRYRTYAALRERVADALGVPLAVLNHLIDAKRTKATRSRLALTWTGEARRGAEAPIDWTADPPFPLARDGSNPLERAALARAYADLAAMPPTRIVRLAIWPWDIATWASENKWKLDVVLGTLSGHWTNATIVHKLAQRLRVTDRQLRRFLDAERAQPSVEAPGGARHGWAASADVDEEATLEVGGSMGPGNEAG